MEFAEKVKKIVKVIPKGKLLTYKLVAQKAGNVRAARAVGSILNQAFRNGERLPCFRVVRSNGQVGGYALGEKEKIKRLKEEGVKIKGKRVVDIGQYLF